MNSELEIEVITEEDYNEEINPEYLDETTFSGWYFLRIVLFGIPVLGLILSIIAVYKNDNKSRKNFAKAFVTWNCVCLLIFGLAAYIASGYIKVLDSSAHHYLGEYGSSLDLAGQLASGDTIGALKKIDLDRLMQTLDDEKAFESEELKYFLANMDLSKIDFTLIDWSRFSEEEIERIYKVLPRKK